MGGITLLVLMVVGLIAMFIGGAIKNVGVKSKDEETETVGKGVRWVGLGVLCLFTFFFLTRCFVVVDPAEVGVQVKFGRILDKTLTEGPNWKDPFAAVDKYNIQLREATMDVKDGNALQALTSDKLSVNIDATIWWGIVKEDVKMIRRNISSDESVMDDMVVFPAIRSAVRDAVVHWTFDDLISEKGRVELTERIDEILIRLTKSKGAHVDRVLIRNVAPEDARVTAAIGAKLQQQQELQAKEYELKKSVKNAEIRIQDATGIAEAQRLIQKTLTPEYLQFERIQMMKQLAGSPNTTFIFDNGNSVPLVFNKDIDKK